MNILVIGPQGAGKGTQAARIAAEYGIPHISTGELLRQAVAAGTDLGRQVEPILTSGGLVPDGLMVEQIRERLAEPDAAAGFILDGFPRTMEQADALDAMLRDVARDLDVVFALQLPDDVAADRLALRASEEGRADDTPDVIRRRLATYREKTEPLIGHYRAKGILIGIHAERSINEVFAEIQRTLDRVGRE